MKQIALFSILSFSLTFATQSFSQDMRLPGSGSSSSGNTSEGNPVDFNKEQSLKEQLNDLAEDVADRFMRCCSSYGGISLWGTVDYSGVRYNSVAKVYIIPMKVGWKGSITGTPYWIEGKLKIDANGSKRWTKISDSGGFKYVEGGCTAGCSL